MLLNYDPRKLGDGVSMVNEAPLSLGVNAKIMSAAAIALQYKIKSSPRHFLSMNLLKYTARLSSSCIYIEHGAIKDLQGVLESEIHHVCGLSYNPAVSASNQFTNMSVFMNPGSRETTTAPSGTCLVRDFVSPSIPNFDAQYGAAYTNRTNMHSSEISQQKTASLQKHIISKDQDFVSRFGFCCHSTTNLYDKKLMSVAYRNQASMLFK